MDVRPITKQDFDRIVEVIDHWWGGPISTFAHPIFFYELGGAALVAEEGDAMIGFLLGFLANGTGGATTSGAATNGNGTGEASRIGYVHLVGIHPDFRRRGVGRTLYDRFTRDCSAAGCVGLKAITTPGYEGSIRFHVALGWDVKEVEDYAGPGRKRIVFTKRLG
ncbi:MAG TPA: GNAT family N-acetyltransferase [Polyangiaceae bacterium]|jgi:GNAT superfamily N-acetyltransferase|nr:GNAT family N-acetyltransferase [Polyangiaceae bacterium]